MVEMRVLCLINIVFIYINRMCTTHGEMHGETKLKTICIYFYKFLPLHNRLLLPR